MAVRGLAPLSAGSFGTERLARGSACALGVLATAGLTSVGGGCAFSRATTSTAAATATSATSTTALLAVTTFTTTGLSGGPLRRPLPPAVLTFGMGVTRATGYSRLDAVSDVVIAVEVATRASACLQAISIGPVGIAAIAVSVAATAFTATAFAATAFAAPTLVPMALAFRTAFMVATLRRTLASILITASLATTVTVTTAAAASFHALPTVTSLAAITAIAPVTSVTAIAS